MKRDQALNLIYREDLAAQLGALVAHPVVRRREPLGQHHHVLHARLAVRGHGRLVVRVDDLGPRKQLRPPLCRYPSRLRVPHAKLVALARDPILQRRGKLTRAPTLAYAASKRVGDAALH
jgi:hypothetical protein